jgi:hypothetical protein
MTAVRHTLGFLEAFAALGVHKIDIAALRYIDTPDEKMIPGDMMDLSDRTGVERRLAWLRRENARGAQVYCRPERSGVWPVVFLDDIPIGTARRIAAKYQSIVVETSPRNCQIWIVTARPLTEKERGGVQKALVTLLDEEGADSASTGGEHFGRLPGFRSHKRGRNGCWTNLVSVPMAGGGKLDPAPYLSISSPEGGVCSRAECPGEARYRGTLSNAVSSGSSESEKEFSFAKHSLAHGRSKEWVIENIAARAKARGKRKSDAAAEEYARRTVEKAAGRLGYGSTGRY